MCLACKRDGRTERHEGRQPKPVPVFAPQIACSLDLAWAAGFFDGEGWTSAHTPPSASRRRYLQVGVAQVDIGQLERFQRAVGVGTINSSRRCSQWRAHNYEAVQAIELLWPMLGPPKREQFLRVYRGLA